MWSISILGFDLYFIFYNFFFYSFLGWIYESCLISFQKKKLVNRGFLAGPIIPIYGCGATLIYLILHSIKNHAVYVFLGGMAVATALEYITSYLMEKIFHAKWWDYSNYRYNFQGRICLFVSLFWGFLSILMTDLLQPIIDYCIYSIPKKIGEIGGGILCFLFLCDLITSVVYIIQLDKILENMQKLREEFADYIEKTKFYETRDDIKEYFENSKISELIDTFKEKFEESIERYNLRQEGTKGYNTKTFRKEMEQKWESFITKYQSSSKGKTIIYKRLIDAFPNMKFINREMVFKDIKEKINEKKKR